MYFKVLHGDCFEVLRTLKKNSIDAVVTDPPYGLEFMGKEWDGADGFRRSLNKNDTNRDNVFGRTSAKGPEYRAGELFQKWTQEWASEVLRVMKPGAHLLAFGGTRTYHRMVCAIEDAGFEIRDQIAWVYGSGFPKSLDVSKAIDKKLGVKGSYGEFKSEEHNRTWKNNEHEGWQRPWRDDEDANERHARKYIGGSDESKQWGGWGSALKPAIEPIVVARKPLSESTLAANVLKWGCGALNIDGCRIGSETRINNSAARAERNGFIKGFVSGTKTEIKNYGRWPANLVHDGSDEVLECFPETAPSRSSSSRAGKNGNGWGMRFTGAEYDDAGSAARFFYTAKADKKERTGSKHPTVKPVALMRYLIRLVARPDTIVLDPFAGTGTIGEAALREYVGCVLIERELEYVTDIKRRLSKHKFLYGHRLNEVLREAP